MTKSSRLSYLAVGTVLALFAAAPLLAQGVVTGSITDRQGQPLGNAQITVAGERRAVVSDGRGQFVIRGLPARSYTLQVHRIGYRAQTQPVTVPAAGSVDVKFQLDVSAVSLDEVVVTGTGGATERRKLGQSVASLDPSVVQESAPVANFTSLLQSRVPGVRSVGITGGIGASNDLRIRGTSSFSLAQRPVMYIDGVRVDTKQSQYPGALDLGSNCCFVDGGAGGDRLHDLNPEDIERVEILKGPAAGTLYGSEATNGVIQIFTKRGRALSAPRWSASYATGLNRLRPNLPTKLFPKFKGPDGTVGKDANEAMIKSGIHSDANLSVQGGAEALTYFVGGGLLYDVGSIQPNDQTRGDLRVNLDWTASDKWSFEVNSGYVHDNTTLLQSGNNWTSLLGNALLGNPKTASAAKPFGEPWVAVADIQKLHAVSGVERWTGGLTSNFRVSNSFTHRLTVGLDQVSEEISKYFPFGSYYTYDGTVGERDLGYTARKNLTFDYLGRLSFTLPAKIGSDFSFGSQGTWTQERRNMAVGKGFAGPGVTVVTGGATTTGAETYLKRVNIGVFAQNRFSFSDRLFVTTGFRLDGNSAFGTNYGSQFYPKADASYVLSDAGFLPGFISNLKVRGAVGLSGLTPGAFDQFRTFVPQAVLADNTGVVPDSPGNDKLAPEKTLGMEGGVEAGFFKDRLGVDFTVYRQKTTNALLGVPLPASQGFNQARLTNVGALQNRGWELALNAAILEGGFRWSTTVSMDGNRNKVLDLGPTALCGTSSVDGVKYCKLSNFRTNYPVSVVFGNIITGYNATTNKHTRSDTSVFRGDPLPHWTGSVGNTFEVGKFRLYGLVSWERGANFANSDRPYAVRFETGDDYLSTFDFSGATPVKTARSDSLFNYWSLVNAFDSRDNVRIREVTVSYELPRGLVSKLGFARTTLALSGQNLMWWDHCHCRDPNGAYTGGADFGFGGDFLSTPQPRKFVATIRTTF
jgi:TonB-dependent SusC/RagA subfamily outer membrane receptor